MATGVEANILAALCDRLVALNLTQPIAWPNVSYPSGSATIAQNYVRVSHLINDVANVTIGDGQQQHRGIFQLTIFWKAGDGLIDPLELAETIVNQFAKGTILFKGGKRVLIYAKPSVAAPMQDGDRVMIPISIPYHSFN